MQTLKLQHCERTICCKRRNANTSLFEAAQDAKHAKTRNSNNSQTHVFAPGANGNSQNCVFSKCEFLSCLSCAFLHLSRLVPLQKVRFLHFCVCNKSCVRNVAMWVFAFRVRLFFFVHVGLLRNVVFAFYIVSKSEVFAFLGLQNIVRSQCCNVSGCISRVFFACGFVARRCFRVLYRFKK